MRYPWEDEDRDAGFNRKWRDENRLGGHRDLSIDEQMAYKNLETQGGYQAKITGDQGEFKLSSILKSLPDYYHIIDNILLQTKKGSTQLDHVVVCPFGIFVVETKNHKGMIFGDPYGAVWTQVLNKGHFTFYNPVLQNLGHIKHLCEQSHIKPCVVQGIIVFTSDNADLRNVNCPCCMNVDDFYYYITSFNNQIFNDRQMLKIIKRLDSINTDSYLNRAKHIDFVNEQKRRRGF